jgi:hypothetical protein
LKYTRQLNLFQERLTEDFYKSVPNSVYCSDDLEMGCRISRKDKARTKRYIQLNNKIHHSIVLDLDYPSFYAWEDTGSPAPNFVVRNKKNNHTHYVYKIYPVRLHEAENTRPMRLLSKVQSGLTLQLKADIAFSGFLSKTVGHDYWETRVVEPYGYELRDLIQEIDPEHLKPRLLKEQEHIQVGRNVACFDAVRKWAYRYVRRCNMPQTFYDGVYKRCVETNLKFTTPMTPQETRGIAKSISKWVWSRFSNEEFSRIQSERGCMKGKTKRDMFLPVVEELSSQGLSQRQISKQIGIPRKTIGDWLKR